MEHQKLYGRVSEIAALKERYHATVSGPSRAQLVLVSGSSGVGKRALASAIKPDVVGTRGIFLSGRCCFYGRQNASAKGPPLTPLEGVCDALHKIVYEVNDETKSSLRNALDLEFPAKDDRGKIIDMLESTGRDLLFNENTGTTPTEPNSTTNMPPIFVKSMHVYKEHVAILTRFIRVVSTCLPVVLSLEHLQHADSASMEFLELLLTDTMEYPNDKGLLVLGLYDGDSTLPDSYAMFAKNEHQPFTHIRLEHLSRIDVNAWIDDWIEQSAIVIDNAQALADVIYNKSCGSPRFISLLLQLVLASTASLVMEDVVLERFRDQINDYASSNEVFLDILRNQESSARHMVEAAAVIDEYVASSIDVKWLEGALQRSCTDDIRVSQESGLLQLSCGRIQFPCPDYQNVLYDSMPQSKRDALHLKIGRRLWKYHTQSSLDLLQHDDRKLVFVAARNLQRGIDLVSDVSERSIIATINLEAGKLVMKLSNFALAASCFDFAILALGDNARAKDNYELTLTLFNLGSEAYYAASDYVNMSRLLGQVFKNASSLQDKLQAYTTQVYATGAQHHLQEAITLCLDVLTKLGEPLPRNPGKFTILVEFMRIKRVLKSKTIRFFCNLPAATSAYKMAAMQLMGFNMLYAYAVNPELSLLSVMRILTLVLKYGMTTPALPAIAAFGCILCLHTSEFELAARCGQIATTLFGLLNPIETQAWLPRISFYTYGNLNRWIFPFRECLDPLLVAHRSGLTSGDLEGSMLTGGILLELKFLAGTELGEVEQLTRSYCQLMDSLGQYYGLVYFVPFHSFLSKLVGGSVSPLVVSVGATELRTQVTQDGNVLAIRFPMILRVVSSYLFGAYRDALDTFVESVKILSSNDAMLAFYGGLSALAVARSARGLQRRKYLRCGKHSAKQLQQWAQSSPANFRNKHTLLKAELATLTGNTTRALTLYHESIQSAQQECFVHEEAIAYMCLAEYQRSIGGHIAATPFYHQARNTFERWGAHSLVRHLNECLSTSEVEATGSG